MGNYGNSSHFNRGEVVVITTINYSKCSTSTYRNVRMGYSGRDHIRPQQGGLSCLSACDLEDKYRKLNL